MQVFNLQKSTSAVSRQNDIWLGFNNEKVYQDFALTSQNGQKYS